MRLLNKWPVAIVMVLIIVGVGSFCAAIGSYAGTSLGASAEFFSNLLSRNITIGTTITELIYIPVPDEDDISRLDIEIAAGTFEITSGAVGGLLEGTAIYNVAMLKPKIVSTGRNVRLAHEGSTKELFCLKDTNTKTPEIP